MRITVRKLIPLLLYLIVIILIIEVLYWDNLGIERWGLEKLDDTIFYILQSTEYAENYSEIKFNSVKVGTNYEQVIGILGTPLRVIYDADGRTLKIVDYVGHDEKIWYPDLSENSQEKCTGIILYYSLPRKPRSHGWYVRIVRLSAEGVVIRIKKSMYVS
ncbi:MAG: hypothetical protein RAO92_02455 [Candidatus Euphemobacter frigidus]|nr:hypothetical protein [Candidatus Euphemobacter frigidus]